MVAIFVKFRQLPTEWLQKSDAVEASANSKKLGHNSETCIGMASALGTWVAQV